MSYLLVATQNLKANLSRFCDSSSGL